MAKPILQYKVNTVVNPLTQEKVYTPMLTDRAPAVSLETVVKSAKDKGYLPGLKDVSAKALAEGVLSSLKDTLAAGTNVKFGDYFYAKLALNGKCDGAGRLSKQNGINVRFRQGELIKVDIDDFELQNLDTPLIPTLDYLLNDLDAALRNVMKESQDFLAIGAKLVGEGTTTKLEVWNVDADGVPTGTDPVDVESVIQSGGPNMLRFTYPANIQVGGRYAAIICRETPEGRKIKSMPVVFTVVA